MPSDLSPKTVEAQVKKGRVSPLYLFHGPDEYRMEGVLDVLRAALVPESVRDFNVHTFRIGGGASESKASPAMIVDTARSAPFMASRRVVVVRNAERIKSSEQDQFVAYLEDPVETACLVFTTSKADFRLSLFRKMRERGLAVSFRRMTADQVAGWIRKRAEELGMRMDETGSEIFQQLVGDDLRVVETELEKLSVRFEGKSVGPEEVRDLTVNSRSYSIFELVDEVSQKKADSALELLLRLLEEEGRDAPGKILGMLNRQVGLLGRAKILLEGKGGERTAAGTLGVHAFVAKKLLRQARLWTLDELGDAHELLYRADDLLKSSAQYDLVLEDLVLSLCSEGLH